MCHGFWENLSQGNVEHVEGCFHQGYSENSEYLDGYGNGKKAIPVADSEAVLKIAFLLPSFSSALFHVIPHLGKQITAVTAS